MAHESQRQFCERMRTRFPEYFHGAAVLDCGSQDINGSNRDLFTDSIYIGVDIGAGKNVDVVSPIHELGYPDGQFDMVISTECFEHDQHYAASLWNIVRMLRPGGLFVFTCATTGRPEHGTRKAHPESSPLTVQVDGWSDYYKNLTAADVEAALAMDSFEAYEFETEETAHDLYFWGVKKAATDGAAPRPPSPATVGEMRCGIVTCQPTLAAQAAEIAQRSAKGHVGLMGFFNGCEPSSVFNTAVKSPHNVGQTKGLDALWRAWPGPHRYDDLMAFIHDDVHVLDAAWDEQVREVMKNPDVLLVGFGGAERVELTPQHAQRFDFVSNMVDAERYGRRIKKAQRVAVLDSFAMIVRMSLLDELGGFEWWPYPYHCVDYALSMEVMKRKKQTWVVPVRCAHLDGRTARTPLYTKLAAKYGGPEAVLRDGTRKLFTDYAKLVQSPKPRTILDYIYRR